MEYEDYIRIRDAGIFPNMRGLEGDALVNAFWENSWPSLKTLQNEKREHEQTKEKDDYPF